ncbi:hypothetical protein [Streptomyces beihaiensis]|uniref:Uncharacterized protein n=1 Tax=Streptomyces beihaiensis TaxID=2984495 RepID=A0ABT3TRI5_9ACTN|nr:hypothetical protein [Streptomyces beihaiensis]MCX3059612.1 hypothetical protein [Streptomyces beihaiensis]
MSREVVLTIQPGESADDFISRIADTAPEPSPSVLDRIRTLLAVDGPAIPQQTAPSRAVRAAA